MGQKKMGKHLKPFTLVKDLFDRYYGHDVARDGAALTYYLLFAIFPLLIFISTLVGLMNLDIEELMSTVSHILPEQVAGIMRSYLEYVSTSPSRQLLVFSLIFSVWFPMRATSCLMHSVRKAYGVSRPASMVGGTLRNFFSPSGSLLPSPPASSSPQWATGPWPLPPSSSACPIALSTSGAAFVSCFWGW